MKATVLISGTNVQLNLEPETDPERAILKMVKAHKGLIEKSYYSEQVGECLGNYLKVFSNESCLSLYFREIEPDTDLPQIAGEVYGQSKSMADLPPISPLDAQEALKQWTSKQNEKINKERP
jgi:hypothetical protein